MNNYTPRYNETRTDAQRKQWLQDIVANYMNSGSTWMNQEAFWLIANAITADKYLTRFTIGNLGSSQYLDHIAFIRDVMYAYGFEGNEAVYTVLFCLYSLEQTDGAGYLTMKDRAANVLAKFDYVTAAIISLEEQKMDEYPFAPMISKKGN